MARITSKFVLLLILGWCRAETTPPEEDGSADEPVPFHEIDHRKEFPLPLFNYPDDLTMYGLPSSDRLVEIFGTDESKTLMRIAALIAESSKAFTAFFTNLQAMFVRRAPLKEKDKRAVVAFLQTAKLSAGDARLTPKDDIAAEWDSAARRNDSGPEQEESKGIGNTKENGEGQGYSGTGLSSNRAAHKTRIKFDLPKLTPPTTGVLFGIEPMNETLTRIFSVSAPVVARVAEDVAGVCLRSYAGNLAATFRDELLDLDYFKDRRRERDAIALFAHRIKEATMEGGIEAEETIFEEWMEIAEAESTTPMQTDT